MQSQIPERTKLSLDKLGDALVRLGEAFSINWIQNEILWLDMIKSRNLSSHVYDEKIADNVYAKIKEYTPELRKTYDFLVKKNLKG